MLGYEIRYLRDDGKLSILYRPDCFSDLEAHRLAQILMRPEFATVEIWRGSMRVEIIQRSRDRLH